MSRLETRNNQHNEALKERNLNLEKRLEDLTGRAAWMRNHYETSRKSFDEYTEKTKNNRTPEQTARLESWKKDLEGYQSSVRNYEAQMAQVKTDLLASESRDKAVMEAQKARVEKASDAAVMERTLVSLLHSYPQLAPKMQEIEQRLQVLEQKVDDVQRGLQSRKMVEAETALLADYKNMLYKVILELQELTTRAREASDAEFFDTVTSQITIVQNELQVRYTNYYKLDSAPAATTTQTSGKVSVRDAFGRIASAYDTQSAAPANGLQNEISNMRVALVAGRISQQQEQKRDVINQKLEAYNPLKLDMSLAHNAELVQILKTLSEKGSSNMVTPGGLLGMLTRMGFERNTELEDALMVQMGTGANKLNPTLISVIAAVVNIANIMKMSVDLLTGGVFEGLKHGIGIATASWGLILGDLKLGRMETLKAIDQHDLDLYVQYTQKLKQLQTPGISEQDKARLIGETQNLGLIMQKRALVTQRDLATVGDSWWAQAGRAIFNEKDPRASVDDTIKELELKDAGNVLPLHDRYMELTRELSGKDLKDVALKGKVDELLALESQLKGKGVEMLSYMDYVRRATGVKITMPSEASDRQYIEGLRSNMTPVEMQKLFATMGDSQMLSHLAGDKEKTAKQASDFVKQALNTLEGAGVIMNIDTAALDTGHPDERLRAASAAFAQIKTQLDGGLKDTTTYAQHISSIETAMAERNPETWQAYEKVKNQPNMSNEEARAILLPKVQELYQQLVTHSEMLNAFTLGIVTGDPSKEMAEGYITRFMNKSFQKEDMLNMMAELYGSANLHQGLGESALAIVKLRRQRDALADINTLGVAIDDLGAFNRQLTGQVELYSTLQDSISNSPANTTEKGKLRSMLQESQTKLQTAYGSLQQFSGDQMASLLGDASHRGVTEDFSEYAKVTRRFLKTHSMEAMSRDMESTLQTMEGKTADEQARLVSAFETKHIIPLRAEFAKLEKMAKQLTGSVTEYEQAARSSRTLEAYNKERSQEGLARAVDTGYTAEELGRTDIQQYLTARTAYRTQVQNLNRTMASFYGVQPAALDGLLNKATHTEAELATLDRLMVVDESAFADQGKEAASLIPTDAKELASETARYTQMKARADAYGRLLAAVGNIAQLSQGNRDAALMSTLVGKGFIAKPRRSVYQRNAYNDLGIIRPEDLKDAAIKHIDPAGKLSKQEIAGLMNTLALLSGSRGHSTRPREGYETFADTLKKSMQDFLPRLRKNLPSYSQNVEGYSEATFIANLVEEQDMFKMLRTIRPIADVPAGTKFINLGIHGAGSPLVLRNNDRRFFTSQVVKNVGGVELAYTVYFKEGCMNVQVPPMNVLQFVRNFRQKFDLPKPGMPSTPNVPMGTLEAPSITREVALKELRELYFTVDRNPVAVSHAAVTALGQIITCFFKTPPEQPTEPTDPTEPGKPTEPTKPIPNKNDQQQVVPKEDPVGIPSEEPKVTPPKEVIKEPKTPPTDPRFPAAKNEQVQVNTDVNDKSLGETMKAVGKTTPQAVHHDVFSRSTPTDTLPVKPATVAPVQKQSGTDVQGVL